MRGGAQNSSIDEYLPELQKGRRNAQNLSLQVYRPMSLADNPGLHVDAG